MKLVTKDGLPVANYQHNAQGQRVIRMVEGEEVHYIYDTQDRLVAEANGDGTVERQYVYLGRLLIAVEEAANDQWFFVHNDHLGTPKLVSNAQTAVIWRGEAAAFGATQSVGELNFGFRFPGQTEDASTGYFYNYFRDYDPSLGRYLQSDPIGLKGGVNTYAYVTSNPILIADYFGLFGEQCFVPGADDDYDNSFAKVVNDSRTHRSEFYDMSYPAEAGLQTVAPEMYFIGLGGAYRAFSAARTSQVTVTSWAAAGETADLAAGRWVMTGGATWGNYVKTFLWGPQLRNGELIIRGYLRNPYSNSITGQLPRSSVGWPSGSQFWRGIYGQRQIK